MKRRAHQHTPKSGRLKWILFLAGFIFSLFIVVELIRFIKQNQQNKPPVRSVQVEYPFVEELKSIVHQTLQSHGLSTRITPLENSPYEHWIVFVPIDLPIPSLHLAIKEDIRRVNACILFAESDPTSKRVSLHVGWQDSCFFQVHLQKKQDLRRYRGRIALIVDDFGPVWDRTAREFLTLGVDLTVSVIPGLKMSSVAAGQLSGAGFEVLLHLPMEAINEEYRDKNYMITTGMDQESIARLIQKGLDEIPQAVGLNNHMGSKITSDSDMMRKILTVVRENKLFYIDSRTIASSVAFDTAQKLGISSGKRDVFIDTQADSEFIRSQLLELARKASRNGFAIGIGHCRKLTLAVLREELPKLTARGYRFVKASEVVY